MLCADTLVARRWFDHRSEPIDDGAKTDPWFARSLNRFGPLKDQAEPRVATNTVHHDATHPSRLVLPIARGALPGAGSGRHG